MSTSLLVRRASAVTATDDIPARGLGKRIDPAEWPEFFGRAPQKAPPHILAMENRVSKLTARAVAAIK